MKLDQVAEAFARGQVASGNNIMSSGDKAFSYQMLIAKRVRGEVRVLSTTESPSVTTSKHIRAIQHACPRAHIVSKL